MKTDNNKKVGNFKLPRYALIDLGKNLLLCATPDLDGISNFAINSKIKSITGSITEATNRLILAENAITEAIYTALSKLPADANEELRRKTIQNSVAHLKWDEKK